MKEWLSRWWKYLVAGGGLLVAALAGLFWRRKSSPPQLEALEREEKERQAAVDRQVAYEKELAALEKKSLSDEHEKETKALEQGQEDKTKSLQASPEELSSWLIEVGNDVRKNSS